MPFTSKAQRAWMHANDPKMARRWEKETPNYVLKRLPNRIRKPKRQYFKYLKALWYSKYAISS